MTRWALCLVLAATACGGRNKDAESLAPARVSPAAIDSMWKQAQAAVRRADWGDAVKLLPPVLLHFDPEDPELGKARYYLGEAHLGRGNHLEAVREFRRVADDMPDAPIAADALLRIGDTYAAMWRRPELDPTYGENALEAYKELTERYRGTTAAERAQRKLVELDNRFAYKALRNAMYYYRLKAYDSAILYLRDLVATHPRSSSTPVALAKIIEAYTKLGYKEDIQEMCTYVRKYHATDRGLTGRCTGVPESTASS